MKGIITIICVLSLLTAMAGCVEEEENNSIRLEFDENIKEIYIRECVEGICFLWESFDVYDDVYVYELQRENVLYINYYVIYMDGSQGEVITYYLD